MTTIDWIIYYIFLIGGALLFIGCAYILILDLCFYIAKWTDDKKTTDNRATKKNNNRIRKKQ